MAEPCDCGHLSKDHHERDKEEDGVDVVVEREEPDVAIHNVEHLLRVDGEQRNEKARQDSVYCAGEAERARGILLRKVLTYRCLCTGRFGL